MYPALLVEFHVYYCLDYSIPPFNRDPTMSVSTCCFEVLVGLDYQFEVVELLESLRVAGKQ